MANLVAPVIKLAPVEQRIVEFRGLNRKNHVEEGEMSDMKNLTSDNYPLLTPRPLRGEIALPSEVKKPLKMIVKYGVIFMIAKKQDDTFAVFVRATPEVPVKIIGVSGTQTDWFELNIASWSPSEETEMVAINSQVCFFPEKRRYTLARPSSYAGYSFVIRDGGHLDYEIFNTFDVTISVEKTTLASENTYSFQKNDAVDIVGDLMVYNPTSAQYDSIPINASCIIKDNQNNKLTVPSDTFIELVGKGVRYARLAATIKRECPDIHHVIEWNNRLWGVNDNENVIYACKLGDPTNWKYYQGTSLDSFYAQQGSDEKWTGCATYSNHLLFMKPNSMTRVYGTAPSNFQVANTACYGVEQGSSNSIAVINDKIFYKSSIGIMAYEGGIPYAISDKFNMKFRNVVAGTEGIKYYASIEKEDGTHELMTLDIDKAIWHKEDDVRFRDTCTLDGSMYFICDEDTAHFEEDKLYAVNPAVPTETTAQRDWMAVFGPFDEYVEDHKIYSRMSLRFIAQAGSTLSISMKMDDGEWELIKVYEYVETGGDQVYIVPRRCDRFSVKIEGSGDIEIKSLTRRYRRGSGVKI